MDGSRFDDLARSLVAGTTSRRETARRLAGGALTAALGGLALDDAVAQEVGTEAYDLECRQSGVRFFCFEDGPATRCKGSSCLCAKSRQDGKPNVCIVSPPGGCPKKQEKCRRHKDCGSGEVCVRVSTCCSRHPGRGKCVKRCPE